VNHTKHTSAAGSGAVTPRVWLLAGHKLGDNAQVLALADALAWSYEIKRFVYRRWELFTNRLLPTTLAGIVRSASTSLGPPWPDLIITAGRRNEPVARWIRARSGGAARIVHVGRPWAAPRHFDLIVSTPQYQLAGAANVLCNPLPLHRVTADRLREAATAWQQTVNRLPTPRIALLVGGNSGAYTLDPRQARRLGQMANALARESSGSLLVTTSARTPPRSALALLAALSVPTNVFRWGTEGADNPYYGYLALADAFIVTGDSVSMLAEACATGRPVHLFYASATLRSAGISALRPVVLLSRLAQRLAPPRMLRDVGAIHRALIHDGRAVWLGEKFAAEGPPAPQDHLLQTAERVRALLYPGPAE
jgi:mitochondrial fission protein ELM1